MLEAENYTVFTAANGEEALEVMDREMVDAFSGHDITVEFDRPTPLQIDGETIPGVTKYRVRSAAAALTAIGGVSY